MKPLKDIWRLMRFRTKVLLLLLLIGVIPLTIYGFVFYQRMTDVLADEVEKTTYINLKKNITELDRRMEEIIKESESLIVDPEFFLLLTNGLPESDISLLRLNKQITRILKSHFDRYEYVYNSFLMTSVMAFRSKDNMYVPIKPFFKSEIFMQADKANGSMVWIPTYEFADMYGLEKFRDINFSYKLMFTAARQINPVYINTDKFNSEGYMNIKQFAPGIERPVLLLQFKDDIFKRVFENLHTYNNSEHFVVDDKGNVIASSVVDILAKQVDYKWLEKIRLGKNGSIYTQTEDGRQLICYSEIASTGWTAAIVIPYKSIVAAIPDFKVIALFPMVLIILLSAVSSILASKAITQPVKRILIVLDKMSQGKFYSRINEHSDDEIGALYKHFNLLSERIENLIQSNYMAKIKEKEAIIYALTSQINPHFITNTLNTINWMAMDANVKPISDMTISLSKMIDYTIRNTNELVTLEQEIECLKNYIFIMAKRFEDMFKVVFKIEKSLMKGYVPKLFLQPIVENAIKHGFKDMNEGGIITIEGKQGEKFRYFSVLDNGIGFADKPFEKEGEISIGLNNIKKRIELLYGIEAGLTIDSEVGSYTRVTLKLPRV